MRVAKVQASMRICAVRSLAPLKARSLAPLNGWACVVKICHDGMLEDTNSLDGAHLKRMIKPCLIRWEKERQTSGSYQCMKLYNVSNVWFMIFIFVSLFEISTYTLVANDYLLKVLNQPGGGPPALSAMSICYRRHTNAIKKGMLLVNAKMSPVFLPPWSHDFSINFIETLTAEVRI